MTRRAPNEVEGRVLGSRVTTNETFGAPPHAAAHSCVPRRRQARQRVALTWSRNEPARRKNVPFLRRFFPRTSPTSPQTELASSMSLSSSMRGGESKSVPSGAAGDGRGGRASAGPFQQRFLGRLPVARPSYIACANSSASSTVSASSATQHLASCPASSAVAGRRVGRRGVCSSSGTARPLRRRCDTSVDETH